MQTDGYSSLFCTAQAPVYYLNLAPWLIREMDCYTRRGRAHRPMLKSGSAAARASVPLQALFIVSLDVGRVHCLPAQFSLPSTTSTGLKTL